MVQINFEHTGKFKHDPDPLKEKNLAQLKAAVQEGELSLRRSASTATPTA